MKGVGLQGSAILAKSALNEGMSHYTFAVYRHVIAAAVYSPFALVLERKVRPKLTLSIFAKIMLLGLLEPVIDQNLYYTGMKYTTATFATAMCNILPALTFSMACILGLEKVNVRRVHSVLKVVGTVITVTGAMLMTLVKGPILEMAWTRGRNHNESTSAANSQDHIKGALMIMSGCFCWACFYILQAITLKSYPAELSLTALICIMGALEGSIVALVLQPHNTAIWSLHFDTKLLSALYSGTICSGGAYFIQGLVMKEKGPVFASAFGPLGLVIVATLGFFILGEDIYLGRVIGAIVIITGLYLVIWGKSKDQLPSKSNSSDQVAPIDHQPTAAKNDNDVETSNHATKGMDIHTFVAYRHAIAAAVFFPFAIVLERKVRPNMTFVIFIKIALLGLLEPVVDQNLYYLGMKYTTATFSAAMCNVLPALTFLMAWILRLEKVNLKKLHSQAKVVGTIVTVGGAMLMTLIKGPVLEMVWNKGRNHHESASAATPQDPVKGAIMITAGCFCWACFVILQAITLKSYPAELSLTVLICLMGAVQNTILTLVVERGNAAIWSIHFDTKLLAAAYSGIICSGVAYYVQGVIMKERGPVFVTAFSPLSMIIVTIMGSIILGEEMYLGSVIGAIVIVIGLYVVIWGKSKDQLTSNSDIEKQVAPSDQPPATMTGNNRTVASNHVTNVVSAV
ncbi:hypothetical protein L1049_011121 [Liquidambar formosana]|uniref:EamA domain-containing protein n=1 Tax=Liquidambar formosana TaxID=63359 RepID=A0AAP0WZI7_LIQFO